VLLFPQLRDLNLPIKGCYINKIPKSFCLGRLRSLPSVSAGKQRPHRSASLLSPALQSTECVFVASHVVSDSGAQSPLASGRGGCSQNTMQVVGQPSAYFSWCSRPVPCSWHTQHTQGRFVSKRRRNLSINFIACLKEGLFPPLFSWFFLGILFIWPEKATNTLQSKGTC